MNQICSDSKYRDILNSILTKIKDRETYKTFYSICNNTKDVLIHCSIPLYFINESGFVEEYKFGESQCLIDLDRSYHKIVTITTTHNCYYYDTDTPPWNLSWISHSGYKVKYIFTFKDTSLMTIQIQEPRSSDKEHPIDKYFGAPYVGVCQFMQNNDHKWKCVSMTVDMQSPILDQDKDVDLPTNVLAIPLEYTSNGARYFETEDGIKYLNQIKGIIEPYLK
jgi:hypothetical protein